MVIFIEVKDVWPKGNWLVLSLTYDRLDSFFFFFYMVRSNRSDFKSEQSFLSR